MAEHERRVASGASANSCELFWPGAAIDGPQLIGLLRKIGRIGIPAKTLSKPTQFTPLEYSMIRPHAKRLARS